MAKTEFVIEPGRHDIVMTHVFDAPRDVVFKAVTDPNLIPKWMGPRRYETIVDRWDVRPGGLWRYVSDRDGSPACRKGPVKALTGSPSSSRTCEAGPPYKRGEVRVRAERPVRLGFRRHGPHSPRKLAEPTIAANAGSSGATALSRGPGEFLL